MQNKIKRNGSERKRCIGMLVMRNRDDNDESFNMDERTRTTLIKRWQTEHRKEIKKLSLLQSVKNSTINKLIELRERILNDLHQETDFFVSGDLLTLINNSSSEGEEAITSESDLHASIEEDDIESTTIPLFNNINKPSSAFTEQTKEFLNKIIDCYDPNKYPIPPYEKKSIVDETASYVDSRLFFLKGKEQSQVFSEERHEKEQFSSLLYPDGENICIKCKKSQQDIIFKNNNNKKGMHLSDPSHSPCICHNRPFPVCSECFISHWKKEWERDMKHCLSKGCLPKCTVSCQSCNGYICPLSIQAITVPISPSSPPSPINEQQQQNEHQYFIEQISSVAHSDSFISSLVNIYNNHHQLAVSNSPFEKNERIAELIPIIKAVNASFFESTILAILNHTATRGHTSSPYPPLTQQLTLPDNLLLPSSSSPQSLVPNLLSSSSSSLPHFDALSPLNTEQQQISLPIINQQPETSSSEEEENIEYIEQSGSVPDSLSQKSIIRDYHNIPTTIPYNNNASQSLFHNYSHKEKKRRKSGPRKCKNCGMLGHYGKSCKDKQVSLSPYPYHQHQQPKIVFTYPNMPNDIDNNQIQHSSIPLEYSSTNSQYEVIINSPF